MLQYLTRVTDFKIRSVCIWLWLNVIILDGEEGSGWSGEEGQSSDDKGQPVHQSPAWKGGGQETGSTAHISDTRL